MNLLRDIPFVALFVFLLGIFFLTELLAQNKEIIAEEIITSVSWCFSFDHSSDEKDKCYWSIKDDGPRFESNLGNAYYLSCSKSESKLFALTRTLNNPRESINKHSFREFISFEACQKFFEVAFKTPQPDELDTKVEIHAPLNSDFFARPDEMRR